MLRSTFLWTEKNGDPCASTKNYLLLISLSLVLTVRGISLGPTVRPRCTGRRNCPKRKTPRPRFSPSAALRVRPYPGASHVPKWGRSTQGSIGETRGRGAVSSRDLRPWLGASDPR